MSKLRRAINTHWLRVHLDNRPAPRRPVRRPAESQVPLLFKDTIFGAQADRPGMEDTLSHLRRDDRLVVWELDRLGRTTKGFIDLVELLKERGIGFKSL